MKKSKKKRAKSSASVMATPNTVTLSLQMKLNDNDPVSFVRSLCLPGDVASFGIKFNIHNGVIS